MKKGLNPPYPLEVMKRDRLNAISQKRNFGINKKKLNT